MIYTLSSTYKFQLVENSAKYTVMMTTNLNFIILSVGDVLLGCSRIGDVVKMLNMFNFITIFYSIPGLFHGKIHSKTTQ